MSQRDILTITDALNSNQVQSFTYDALNRLTTASTNCVGQGQYAQNYGYDPTTGNLASKSDGGRTVTRPRNRMPSPRQARTATSMTRTGT